MHFLNISQSYYIIAQEKESVHIGLSFFMIIIVICIYFLIREYRKEKVNRKYDIIEVSIFASISFTILSGFIYFSQYKKILLIEKNYKETIGVTKSYLGDGEVEYKYVVNDSTYLGSCNSVFNGHELDGIKYRNGQYVVIFDSLNPSNSEMDFKRMVENK